MLEGKQTFDKFKRNIVSVRDISDALICSSVMPCVMHRPCSAHFYSVIYFRNFIYLFLLLVTFSFSFLTRSRILSIWFICIYRLDCPLSLRTSLLKGFMNTQSAWQLVYWLDANRIEPGGEANLQIIYLIKSVSADHNASDTGHDPRDRRGVRGGIAPQTTGPIPLY